MRWLRIGGARRSIAVAACLLASVAVVRTAAAVVSSSDASAPSLTITAPAGGSTVSGTVQVSASSSDDVNLAGVQFRIDGANLGAEDTSGPYSVSWDTTTAANGSHTITAVARDATGNTATVNVPVNVSNVIPPPPSSISVKKIFEGSDTDRQVHYFAVNAAVPAGHTLLLTHASTVDDTDGTGGIVTPNGISDPRGNVWAQDAVSHPGTSFTTVETWSAYVSVPLQAGDPIQVKGYPRGLSDEIAVFDVNGLAGPSQSSRLDQRAGSAAYSQAQSTPFVSTTQAHELVVGVHAQSHASAPWWTPETLSPPWVKYVDRFDTNIAKGIGVVMREVTAIGSYSSRGTDSSSQTQNNLIVTYKATL